MNIIFITETCSGGHWEALLNTVQLLKIKHADIKAWLVAVDAPLDKQDLMFFEESYFTDRVNFNPPAKQWKQIFLIVHRMSNVLKKFVKKDSVIITTSPFGVYATQKINKICLYWFHGWRSSYLISDSNKNWKEWLQYQWEKYAMENSFEIIVPNEETREKLLLLYNNRKSISVIKNPINNSYLHSDVKITKSEFLKKLGISTKHVLVSYVGRIAPFKGLEELVRAVDTLHVNQSNVTLIIAHQSFPIDATVQSKLLEYIHANNMQSIIFIEDLSTSQLKCLYFISNVVILPSHNENSPMTMWECLISSGIFVGSPVGDMKKTLQNIDSRLVLYDNSVKGIQQKLIMILKWKKKLVIRIKKKAVKLAMNHCKKSQIDHKMTKILMRSRSIN